LAFRLRRALARMQPAAVLAFLHYPAMISAMAMVGHSCPHFVAERSNPDGYLTARWTERLRSVLVGWAYRRAMGVTFNSTVAMHSACARWSIPAGRAHHIPNGLDLEAIRSGANEPCPEMGGERSAVICVGRLSPEKDHELGLRAFKRLLATEPDATLWVLGEGPLLEHLRALADSMGLQERVHWCGFQSNPFRFIARARCMLLTSRYEGMPNVVLEAMALGVPTVATVGAGSSIIQHGVTGLLAEAGDESQLADDLVALLSDRELSDRIRGAAIAQANECAVGLMVARYGELLHAAL